MLPIAVLAGTGTRWAEELLRPAGLSHCQEQHPARASGMTHFHLIRAINLLGICIMAGYVRQSV